MQKMKYLTITVPCFNSEKYLRRCLDSLIIGGDDVEIIVIDAGSTVQPNFMRNGFRRL